MAKRLDIKDLNIYYGNFHAVKGREPGGSTTQHHGLHRTVGLRQIDGPTHPQPHARGHARRLRGRQRAARRGGHLRSRRRPGERARHHRYGVPAAQPVPDDVDPRQRRRRAATAGHAQQRPNSTRSPNAACAGPTCGTRSRTASTNPAADCPVVSSSGCASRGPSRSHPRCC